MGIFDEEKKGYGVLSYMDDEDDEIYNNLEDYQKEEVDKGNQDSFNFEEEDLEEDDYYDEDDDE